MMISNYFPDDCEIQTIEDNIISYYNKLQDHDDEEIRKITSKAISHMMKVSFDDMNLSINELSYSMQNISANISRIHKK